MVTRRGEAGGGWSGKSLIAMRWLPNNQSGQKVLKTPVIPGTARSINRRIAVQAGLGINRDPISKLTNASRPPVAHVYIPNYLGG
jgi:hypothetical protein